MSFISASSEIVALFLAGKMLELLGVNINSIIILLAFAIRFAGYYYIRRPYFLLFMETMHYFNFGILYILIAQRADSIGRFYTFVFTLSKKNNYFLFYSSTGTCWYTSRCCLWTFLWFRCAFHMKEER